MKLWKPTNQFSIKVHWTHILIFYTFYCSTFICKKNLWNFQKLWKFLFGESSRKESFLLKTLRCFCKILIQKKNAWNQNLQTLIDSSYFFRSKLTVQKIIISLVIEMLKKKTCREKMSIKKMQSKISILRKKISCCSLFYLSNKFDKIIIFLELSSIRLEVSDHLQSYFKAFLTFSKAMLLNRTFSIIFWTLHHQIILTSSDRRFQSFSSFWFIGLRIMFEKLSYVWFSRRDIVKFLITKLFNSVSVVLSLSISWYLRFLSGVISSIFYSYFWLIRFCFPLFETKFVNEVNGKNFFYGKLFQTLLSFRKLFENLRF